MQSYMLNPHVSIADIQNVVIIYPLVIDNKPLKL